MMSEIVQRGPITCSIACPNDFVFNYTGGVYVDTSNSTAADVDHDIEVVGWGHEDSRDFWHIRNSWGESPAVLPAAQLSQNSCSIELCMMHLICSIAPCREVA